MSDLTYVPVTELTAADLSWLVEAVKTSYTGTTASMVLDEAGYGLYQFWRVRAGDGIIVTRILNHPAGREMYIAYLAGEGLFDHLPDLAPILFQYAKEQECRWIGGMATRAGLGRVYERKFGATPLMVYYLKEVGND